jgi:hypothetical protein
MILQAEHPVQGTAPNDNVNAAIPASRGQRMDCTLKAVECVSCTIHGHFERLVVVVSAGFAGRGGAARLPPYPDLWHIPAERFLCRMSGVGES